MLDPADKHDGRSKFNYGIYYIPSKNDKDVMEFNDMEFLRPDGSRGGKISFTVTFEYGEGDIDSLDVKRAMEFVLDNYDLETVGCYGSEPHPYPQNVLDKYIRTAVKENLWEYYDTLKEEYKFVENNLYVEPKIVTSLIPGIFEAKIREELHLREKFYELTGYVYSEGYYPKLIIKRLEFYK